MSLDYREVLKSHITTERTTLLREQNNEYVFEVDRQANKYVIRSAVELAFKVKVASVHTMMVPGTRRRMGRTSGKTPVWKKAIVRLKQGEVISMFENV
jgi:large subunit ribosomal protein L23